MSKMNDMAEWLEVELAKADKYCLSNIGAFIPHPFKVCLDKARQLLAEEAAQKPTAPASLVEDYDAGLLNDYGGGKVGWWHDYIREVLTACNEHWREALSRYTPTESIAEEALAVLADRMGYDTTRYDHNHNDDGFFYIKLHGYPPAQKFMGITYAAAEAKARQYLESLPDKGGK
jgi:hypothetical protein